MDPVTHVLVGAAVAKTSRVRRFHFWALMILAELPDLDVFFGKLGFHGLLAMHRSWTHSFLAAGFLGIAAWWLGRRFWDLTGPCHAGIYLATAESHPLCDWMTSYGTPLLWPFSPRNFSLDWVSNLSLGPLAILACGLLALKIWKGEERRTLATMWGALGIFLMASVLLRSQAMAFIKPADQAYALPDLVNPLRWRVIDEDRFDREYRLFSVRPLSGACDFLGAYPMPPDSPWIGGSQTDLRVQRYLRNDRWPVAWVTPRDGGAVVEWGNLLFHWSGRLRGLLSVEMDSTGKVTSVQRSTEVKE